MADRPSKLWKDLSPETRLKAATAFWRDEDSPEIEMQHIEAALVIARRMNFRPKSVAGLSVERRARALSQIPDLSDSVATRALIAYHFADQRALMGAFLDALGVAHENGLIAEETLPAPDADRIRQAVSAVSASFPQADVVLYLRTLLVLDPDTWTHLPTAIPVTA